MSDRGNATLPVAFFEGPAEAVARALIGAVIVSKAGGEVTEGRIVETEAYLGERDPASHGYLGRRNARNASLYAGPATWYVYLSYGMHWCANLVCAPERRAQAVLLRALEPRVGLEVMRARRGGVADRVLCSGPGRLCQALGITRELDGKAMPTAPVIVRRAEKGEAPVVVTTPRIGLTQAADWPLRFVLRDSPWASRRARPVSD